MHTKKLTGGFLLATDYKLSLASTKIANDAYITPSITINSSEEEMLKYIEELNYITGIEKIDYVFPIRTGDVAALVTHYDELKFKALIPTTNVNKLEMLNDKFMLMCLLEELKLPHPLFTKFTNVEEFDICANRIIQKLEDIDDKVVIKPRKTSGSRGMRIVSLSMDNDAKWDQFINKKPSENIYMTKKQLIATAGWTRTFDMIMMEYLSGDEFTVDCLCNKGELLMTTIRKRIATDGGISSKAVIVHNINYPDIMKACKEIVKNLNLSYNVGFQFKCDSRGIPKMIECNPRLQGTTCLSLEAGRDFIYGSIMIAEGLINKCKLENQAITVDYMERTYQEWYEKGGLY